MYLVLIAWLYVALMMAVAEATSPVGSVLGALITFVLYGALPMGVVGYILGTPARKRARLAALKALEAQTAHPAEEAHPAQAAQAAHPAEASALAPNASREAAGHAIAAVRKEP